MTRETISIIIERKEGDKICRSQHTIDGDQFDYFLDPERFLMRIISENREACLRKMKEDSDNQ